MMGTSMMHSVLHCYSCPCGEACIQKNLSLKAAQLKFELGGLKGWGHAMLRTNGAMSKAAAEFHTLLRAPCAMLLEGSGRLPRHEAPYPTAAMAFLVRCRAGLLGPGGCIEVGPGSLVKYGKSGTRTTQQDMICMP